VGGGLGLKLLCSSSDASTDFSVCFMDFLVGITLL